MRTTMYRSIYKEKMLRYFSAYLNMPPSGLLDDENATASKYASVPRAQGYPTFVKFALMIGVCPDTLLNWCDKNESFAEAYRTCREIEKAVIIEGGLTERFNSSVVCKILDLQASGRTGRATRYGGNAPVDGIEINIYDKHQAVDIAKKGGDHGEA